MSEWTGMVLLLNHIVFDLFSHDSVCCGWLDCSGLCDGSFHQVLAGGCAADDGGQWGSMRAVSDDGVPHDSAGPDDAKGCVTLEINHFLSMDFASTLVCTASVKG